MGRRRPQSRENGERDTTTPLLSNIESVASVPRRRFIDRWYGKMLVLLIGTLLLTLSYAPFYQFWAGWIGLVPFIIVLSRTAGPIRAACWGWLAGVLFFSANVWWLLTITGPGVVALVLWLGLYWALAAMILRSAVVALGKGTEWPLPAMRFLLLFPVVWVGAEWIRGNAPFQGFSWFNLSYSQTPALILCQIADTLGEHGVSFWVAMVNALAAMFVINGWRLRGLLRPTLAVCVVLAVISVYGAWRFAQTATTQIPGPTVLLVQPNVPQSNTGDKGAPMDELIDFHVSQTHNGLKNSPDADLVVWSETMMPELNAEYPLAIDALGLKKEYADDFKSDGVRARREIATLGRMYGTSLLVGGSYAGGAKLVRMNAEQVRMSKTGRRNSAYYFTRDTGELVDRYDKIHLVPFGEYIPFEQGFPWLYRQLIALGPPNMADYQLDRGERAVVFNLPKDRRPANKAVTPEGSWRFVTSICFEDADAELNAWLFRGGKPRGSIETKQADFIVNVSNDGWFSLTMMPQHLQIACMRSIENRVPTVRSVNTGISGYIDALGRARRETLIPAGSEGSLAARVQLDSRTTFFTRWGNLMGPGCAIGVGILAVIGWVGQVRKRRAKQPSIA